MASDIFRCVGQTLTGRRCKHTAVRAVKTRYYVCPLHAGKPTPFLETVSVGDDEYETPPTSLPVYHSGMVHIKAELCATCVFRPGNLMMLQPGRLKDLVDENLANGSAITCHKTTFGQAEQEATCRGFFDAYGDKVPAFRLAKAMDAIKEVE